MNFLRLQFLFLRCIIASLLIISFSSCQDSKKEFNFKNFLTNDYDRQTVPVPESFTADSASKLAEHIDSIFTYLHKRRGFNGTVLVTKYDLVVHKGAYGYADFYTKDTLTTETAFQLASVSKQFTAMAIMMLEEEGELSYEDSVQQYIPDFPYKGITIRQLLTHRSGLPNYTYFSDELWPDRKKPITNDDVLKLMAEHKPPIYHKPDTRFNYSNTGYFILASIVEKVADKPFAVYLQEHIFEPLDMKSTFTFSEDIVTVTGKIATGHNRNRNKRTSDYLDTVLGDKGMFSTVEDLYKWDQALYTNKLVSKETIEEAFKGSRTEKKFDEDYGFGWRILELESNGDTVVYHGGLWHGYSTYLLRNPNDHSAIIILSNLPNGSFTHLKDIRKFLYPARPESIASKEKKGENTTGQKAQRLDFQPLF